MSTVAVIGAGAVGLSIAYTLRNRFDIIVIDKSKNIGTGISARNSEVIHAGIYYPPHSLKSVLCIKGRHLLYEYLSKNNLDYMKRGKYIVSTSANTDDEIEQLYINAHDAGAEDIKHVVPGQLQSRGVQCSSALFSPETGVFSAHQFMDSLAYRIRDSGDIALGVCVLGIERKGSGFLLHIEDTDGKEIEIYTDIVINAAGLGSAKLSKKMGYEYKIHYCKGSYFSLSSEKPSLLNELIYPVPEKRGTGLGIHLTIDIGGRMKLGPDTEYVNNEDYSVNNSKKEIFFSSAKAFLPWISKNNIEPDMAGIRPKLQGPDDSFRDFIIENRNNFINLIGIESPGLTASLAIAEYIDNLI